MVLIASKNKYRQDVKVNLHLNSPLQIIHADDQNRSEIHSLPEQCICIMVTKTSTDVRYCWGCLTHQPAKEFRGGRCRKCRNQASRRRMRSYRARQRQKNQQATLNRFRLSEGQQSADDVQRTATALLAAFGGPEGLAASTASLLEDETRSAAQQLKMFEIVFTCLAANEQLESRGRKPLLKQLIEMNEEELTSLMVEVLHQRETDCESLDREFCREMEK